MNRIKPFRSNAVLAVSTMLEIVRNKPHTPKPDVPRFLVSIMKEMIPIPSTENFCIAVYLPECTQ
jgi:hypothetical protein